MSGYFGVIMAGGGGERFWPLSRRATPKQLLNLSGKEVMVNEAVDRLSNIIPRENILIVTNAQQATNMRAVTAERIHGEHVLSEPCARNTAACIGYAAMKIYRQYGDGVMVITPSDAYIRDNKTFTEILKRAVSAAEHSDSLVTVGITPTFPATGYGYICFEKSDNAVKKVLRFVEKPNLELAQEYLKSGDYVWNSGMFIWKVSVILDAFKQYIPDVYDQLVRIGDSLGTPEEQATLEEVYPKIRSVSIDYAIMEKSNNILVVPGEFGWSDVGSWDMLNAIYSEDENGNVIVGDCLSEDTSGCIVYSKKKLVSTVGLRDIIVVDTPDAILVCAKDRAQDVKKIVEKLRNQGREDLL